MLTFSLANADTFFEVKHFLKQHKTYSANRDDVIYLARNHNKLIGTARLLKIQGAPQALWLRGLFIDTEFRYQGIASQLLNHINKQELHPSAQIFAFVEPHLQDFYLGNHYRLIDDSELPNKLQDRFMRAQQRNKKWLCFVTEETNLG